MENLNQENEIQNDNSVSASQEEPPHPHYDEQSDQTQQQTADESSTGADFGNEINSPNNSSGSSMAGIVGIIIAVLVVGGGAALAYQQFGGGTNQTQPGLQQVVEAHRSLDSFQYNVALSGKLSLNVSQLESRDNIDQFKQALPYIPNTGNAGSLPNQLLGEISVTGDVEIGNDTARRGRNDFSISVGGNELEKVLDISARYADNTGYVNPRTLPEIPMFPTKSFEQQWFSFSATSTPTSLTSLEMDNEVETPDNISTEAVVEIMQSAQTEGLIQIANTEATDLESGEPAFRYDLTLHPDKIPAFSNKAVSILREEYPELSQQESFEEFATELQNQASSSESIEREIPVQVLVSSDPARIQQIGYDKTFSKSELISSTTERSDLTGLAAAELSLTLTFSQFNEPISVESPATSTPLEEAVEQLPFFGGMSSASQSSRDARRQTDLNQIATGLTSYKDNNGKYPQSLYEGQKSLANSTYMSSVPKDPAGKRYQYTRTLESEVCLGTTLEDSSIIPRNHSSSCLEKLKKSGGPESLNYAVGSR